MTFDKLNFKKWWLTKFKINLLPTKHLVDRYFDALSPISLTNDNKGLDFFIPEKDKIAINSLAPTFQKGYVAYAIGGQYFTKQLPKERIIEVCQKINQPIILLGGKEDAIVGEEIEQFFNENPSKNTIIFNACGKYNLNQSASLLEQATSVFSHDTGLMHIASAFQKEIYSIWGNTTPELGFYPYQTKFTVFENKKLDCRPCSKIGFHECPKGHFKCMKEIDFDIKL